MAAVSSSVTLLVLIGLLLQTAGKAVYTHLWLGYHRCVDMSM